VAAAVQGRSFVVPDDVKLQGRAVLRHRLILSFDGEAEGISTDWVVKKLLEETRPE
jgi:MoxR-like ATPase